MFGTDCHQPDDGDDVENQGPSPTVKKSSTKRSRRPWSSEEREMMYRMFGADITKRHMPRTWQIAEVARKLPGRTIAQIRTQVNNYIRGKSH